MVWGALDDGMCFHPKILAAGNEAIGAWARAISWSSAKLTDGLVPRAVALTIATEKVWDELVRVTLCEVHEDGWQLHDFTDWNPSAKKVKAGRARKAKNIRDFRDRHVTGYTTGNGAGDRGGYEPVEKPSGSRLRTGGAPTQIPYPDPNLRTENKIVAAEVWDGARAREGAPPAPAAAAAALDDDIERIARTIANEPKFAGIDALDMAMRTMPVGNRKPVAWYLQAVADAAADTVQGETVQARQTRLRRYLQNARAPHNTAELEERERKRKERDRERADNEAYRKREEEIARMKAGWGSHGNTG